MLIVPESKFPSDLNDHPAKRDGKKYREENKLLALTPAKPQRLFGASHLNRAVA